MSTAILGRVQPIHRGAYSATTAYTLLDMVSYGGGSYVALRDTMGNVPTNATYWGLMAERGDDGREIEVRINNGYMQWRYVGDATWTNIVATEYLRGPQGVQGNTGIAATIEVGLVTTGAPGTSVQVTNVGTVNAARFNFTIPRGADGAGAGDMTKAVYDTNANGIVDNSEKLGGQLPAYYATQSDLDDISSRLTPASIGAVNKAGDTMTGLLTLSGAPTANLHAATKAYVDAAKPTPEAIGAVNKAGDTMTGFLTLNAAPTETLHAATKGYIDTSIQTAIQNSWAGAY